MTHARTIEELLGEAGWLRRLAASLVADPSQVDDLVQDTWLSALRNPPERDGDPRPWLARVARNLGKNARRERARRGDRETFVHEERTSPATDALAQEAEAQRLLAEAVTRLADPLRDAIVLRYFQGLDSQAAARQLGVPASTLRTRLQRALEELRADLDRRSAGGRNGWALLLAPLARAARPEAAASSAATAAGPLGLAWSTWSVAMAATGLFAVLVVGARAWLGDERAESGAPAITTAAGVLEGSPSNTTSGSSSGTSTNGREAAEAAAASTLEAPTALLEAGGVVAGTIRVDGRPPEWPIQLTLDQDQPEQRPGDLPRRRQRLEATLTPEMQGVFRFEGLVSGWHGRLRVNPDAFLDGTHDVTLAEPTTGLELALLSRHAIYGRIVDPEGRPAADLTGTFTRHTDDSGHWTSELQCRNDGRFRVPVFEEGWSMLDLRIEDAHGFLQHSTGRLENGRDHDLGDLVLEPVRPLRFTVRDLGGAPLEAALVRVEPVALAGWDTTGADGTGELPFAPDHPMTLRFSAFRFADRVVEAQPGTAVEVVLEPLSTLTLRWNRASGDVIVVTAEVPAFVWDATGWAEDAQLQVSLGAAMVNEWHPREHSYRFDEFHAPQLELVGLIPDVPVTLELRGADGRVRATRTLSVAKGERAVLPLEEPAPGAPETVPAGTLERSTSR